MHRALALRTSRRRSSARATVIGLPLRLTSTVAPSSAASALGGIGTHMSSQTSTCRRRPGTSVAAKMRSGPKGTSSPPTVMELPVLVVARREPAALVELAVVGQVGLRRDAEDLAAVDHDRAVVDPVALHERRADDEHRQQVGARLDDLGERLLHRVEQRVLEEEVVDGVAAQAQLGEHRHRDVSSWRPAPAR